MSLEIMFEDALTDFQKYYGYKSKEIIKAYKYYTEGKFKESAFVIRTFSAKSLTATPNEIILWAERINSTIMSFNKLNIKTFY